MSDHVYKKVKIVGSSPKSVDDAIRKALDTAKESIDHMRWFEVDEIRGHIGEDNDVDYFQVTLEIGFTIESSM